MIRPLTLLVGFRPPLIIFFFVTFWLFHLVLNCALSLICWLGFDLQILMLLTFIPHWSYFLCTCVTFWCAGGFYECIDGHEASNGALNWTLYPFLYAFGIWIIIQRQKATWIGCGMACRLQSAIKTCNINNLLNKTLHFVVDCIQRLKGGRGVMQRKE